MLTFTTFATIARDVRGALRYATRRPLSTAAVVGTLTLGISATTVAYGLATAVLWRPLPFRDADRLVFVWEASERDGRREVFRVTSGRFAEWRQQSRAFASMALFGAAGFSLEGADGVSSVRGGRVSAAFFETLGVAPVLGRSFTTADEIPGQHQVLVLSHAFWQQRLGGRADVLGQSVRLSGLVYTVIGVMPPVVFPGWPSNPASVSIDASLRECWVPIARTPALDTNTRSHVFGVVARLAPGISMQHATDELMRIATQAAADPHGGAVTPIREQFVRDARLPLLALTGAAVAFLLVACANLAALQISAFESRRAEMAVRAALGATAGRLAGQLAVEAMILALVAGATGMLVADYVLAALPERLPPNLPFLTSAVLDFRVAIVATLIAIGSGVLIAAWPVGHLLRSDPTPRGVAPGARGSVFRVLVAGQVAVSITLVASAALLMQSLWSVRSTDPGFVLDGVVIADIGLPAARDTPAKIAAFETAVRRSFENRAEVRAAALAYDHPLEANWIDAVRLDGADAGVDSEIRSQAQLRIVSANYFDALDVEILSGRTFNDEDGLGRPGVAVVNEAFVREHGATVVGRRLRSAAPQGTWGLTAPGEFEIVGVVENERFRGLESPSEAAVYLSTRQFPQTGFTLLLRMKQTLNTASEIRAVARDLRAGVRAVEPAATVSSARTLTDLLDDQLVARSVTANVISGFSGAALALAALGVYGVLSLLVASRTREIGIRLALGASPARIAGRIVRESLRNAAPGLALGVALAFVAGRLLEGVLVGVTAGDPVTLAVVAVTMLGTAVLAALIPAVRAARVDPAVALRSQ